MAQQPISKAYMEKAVGKIKQVIIEEYDEDICMYVGRAESQAPEVDGVTYISSPVPLILGQIVPCKIVQANEYDWMGEKRSMTLASKFTIARIILALYSLSSRL